VTAGVSEIETRLQGLRQLAEVFTGSAGTTRQDLIAVTELGLRLLTLHDPIDSGGISSDPSSPLLRCRSCTVRFPCPTMTTVFDTLGRTSMTD